MNAQQGTTFYLSTHNVFLPVGEENVAAMDSGFILVRTHQHDMAVGLLFIMLYKVILTFESVDEILIRVTKQKLLSSMHSPVVLFILLYKDLCRERPR